MSIDDTKIKSEFSRIKNLGYIENKRSDLNDGAAGNTFEDLLGVQENNLKNADFEGFEVKTKKQISGSWITLFSLKPDHPDNGDNYIRKNWGINDEEYPNIKVFRTSLHAHRWSKVYEKYKIKVDVDRINKKVFLVKADLNENINDRSVYWDFDKINNGIKKLKNTFVVSYASKIIDNKIYYKYLTAQVFKDYIGDKKFIDLIENGTVRYDNRLGIYRTGKKKGTAHNHGGGFRIAPKNIHLLFNSVINL